MALKKKTKSPQFALPGSGLEFAQPHMSLMFFLPGKRFNISANHSAHCDYNLGSPWNAYALCLDDALEIGKGWVQAAVKGA